MQQVVDALAGQGGAGQAVDLVSGLGRLRIDAALDDLHGQLALLIEQGLAGPQRLPLRIVHLAAETGGLAVLVEAETDHGVEVALDRDEAVQGRPQAVAAHRQDQGFQRAILLHHVHGGEMLAALDRSDVLLRRQGLGQLGVLGRLERVEAGGILGIAEGAFIQVHHAGADALGEQRLHLFAGHARLTQAGDGQDAALLVQLAVLRLGRLERHGRAGDEHRADQAHQHRDGQGTDGRFLVSHGRSSA